MEGKVDPAIGCTTGADRADDPHDARDDTRRRATPPGITLRLRWQVSWLADQAPPAGLPDARGISGVSAGRSPLTVAGAAAALGINPHRVPF